VEDHDVVHACPAAGPPRVMETLADALAFFLRGAGRSKTVSAYDGAVHGYRLDDAKPGNVPDGVIQRYEAGKHADIHPARPFLLNHQSADIIVLVECTVDIELHRP